MVPYQAIDAIGPLDILNSGSVSSINALEASGFPIPPGLSGKAIDITFHHISETLSPVHLYTANLSILPTTTCATCPVLDYLLVGGPDPMSYQLSKEFSDFIKKHVGAGKGLFTTCTGAICVAPTGILDGERATTNHMALDRARTLYPKVQWVKEQWVEEGTIWTAGGACAGMDMMAHWVRTSYGEMITQLVLEGLDFEPRDREGRVAAKTAA